MADHSKIDTFLGGTPTIFPCYGTPKNPRLLKMTVLSKTSFWVVLQQFSCAMVLQKTPDWMNRNKKKQENLGCQDIVVLVHLLWETFLVIRLHGIHVLWMCFCNSWKSFSFKLTGNNGKSNIVCCSGKYICHYMRLPAMRPREIVSSVAKNLNSIKHFVN